MIREAVGGNDTFAASDGNGDTIGADARLDAICVSARREGDEEEQNTGKF